MTSPGQMRAGNHDRERVVGLLQQAYAEGRLSTDELRERAAAAQGAQKSGDLDRVVADLPVPPPSTGGNPATVAVPSAGPGSSVQDPLILDGGWSSEKREGRWQIPQYLLLRGGAGTVKLNCLEARTEHSVIQVWVEGGVGTVTVVVPQGWAADTTGLSKSLGKVRNKVDAEPSAGRPILVVHGTVGLGTFTVRHANWFERRAAEKKLR